MGIITLTQFVHPNGEQREAKVELPDEVCELAKDQDLSCRFMPDAYSNVMFYSKKKEWKTGDEDFEIASNYPGENSPKNALEKLIRRVSKTELHQKRPNPVS